MIPFPPELSSWRVLNKIYSNRGAYQGSGGTMEEWGNDLPPGRSRHSTGISFSEKWMCGCCGSGEMQNLSFSIENKEDFLSTLLSHTKMGVTWYFIADDYQMNIKSGCSYYADDFIKLMIDCGAREIDDTLNQVHGPCRMHLFIWSPSLNVDKIAKYIDPVSYTPNWWMNFTDEQRQKHLDVNAGILKDRQRIWAEEITSAERRAKQVDTIKLYDLLHKYPTEAEKYGWVRKPVEVAQNVKL